MMQQTATEAFYRRDLRTGFVGALLFAAAPIILILGACLLRGFEAGSGGPVVVTAEVFRWLADDIGRDALADATDSLGSLSTLLVTIYVSDFAVSRRVRRGEIAPELALLSDVLSFAGALIAAYSIDLVLLVVVTVCMDGAGFGHLVAVVPLAVVTFILGGAAGLITVRSVSRLRKFNDQARSSVRGEFERLRPFVPRGFTVRRAVLLIVFWAVSPTLLAVGGIVWVALEPTSVVAVVVGIGFVLGLLIAVPTAVIPTAVRSWKVQRSWMTLPLVGYVAVVFSAGTVVVIVLLASRSGGWLSIFIGCFIGAVQALAWIAPRRTRSEDRRRWWWAPGFAVFRLIYRTLIRRRLRLRAFRTQLEMWDRELGAADGSI